MDCYVGAATGALKSILLKDNSFFNVKRVKDLVPKNDEITAMIWADEEQTELLTAQLDRQLKILDCAESAQSTMFTIEGGDGPVKGIHLAPTERIVTCVESGAVKIWSKKGKEQGHWSVGEGITSMQGSNEKNLLATGGRKNLVKTWDIETGKQIWSAKNVPLDMLQLEVPIMITDLRFVDDGNQIIEATKLHEMRLYDPRAQRRPVKKIPFMDSPVTTVSTCYRPFHIVAANAVGEMGLFDIRSKVHPLYKYKGQTGSIRSLDGHPTAPYVASCGIDRFVRVHDMESRKLIHKIYCKTRMNKILIRKDLSILKKVKKEEEDWEQLEDLDNSDDEDESEVETASSTTDDEIWDELNNGKNKSRKRKDSDEEVAPEPAKKTKQAPLRKRKDSEAMDEVFEEPLKKSKKEKKQPEIKEEPLSDEKEDEPVPAKKRKVQRKKKN